VTGASHSSLWPVQVSSSNPIAAEVYYRNKSLSRCPAAYEVFFGLRENPFSLTPDPRYLYRTPHAHETLHRLTRGILARKGLILLSGEVGTGKTILLNTALHLLRQNPSVGNKTRIAVLVHPTLSRAELLEAVLTGFKVPCAAAHRERRLQALLAMLLEVRRKGGAAVLAIDEAQHLTPGLLDELRVLLNLQTGHEQLLQIVLCGQPEIEHQPEIAEMLSRQETDRLRPLVTVRCKTAPLTQRDTRDYIEHRMKVAGAKSESIFAPAAGAAVHLHSHGIPRVVNLLCAHALATAGLRGVPRVFPQMIEEAATKVPFTGVNPCTPRSRRSHPDNGTATRPPAAPSTPPAPRTHTPAPTTSHTPSHVTSYATTRTTAPPVMQSDSPRACGAAPFEVNSADRVSLTRARGSLSILVYSQWMSCWWSANFNPKRPWLLLRKPALTGALSLTLAQALASATPWQRTARATLGFLGLLLLDIALGLAAYVLLYEHRKGFFGQVQKTLRPILLASRTGSSKVSAFGSRALSQCWSRSQNGTTAPIRGTRVMLRIGRQAVRRHK
jgi:general secretion pathway protein A